MLQQTSNKQTISTAAYTMGAVLLCGNVGVGGHTNEVTLHVCQVAVEVPVEVDGALVPFMRKTGSERHYTVNH